jgi:hypothetical protein
VHARHAAECSSSSRLVGGQSACLPPYQTRAACIAAGCGDEYDWNIGLKLQALARAVLPERSAPPRRVGLARRSAGLRRIGWRVLLAAATGFVPSLIRADAARVLLRRQKGAASSRTAKSCMMLTRRSPTSSLRGPAPAREARADRLAVTGADAIDPGRLEDFVMPLPRGTVAAAELGARHDAETDEMRPMRYALEPRSLTFFTAECVDILRRYDVALVVADRGRWPLFEGSDCQLRQSAPAWIAAESANRYSDPALDRWATAIAAWARGSQPEKCPVRHGPATPRSTPLRCVLLFRQRWDARAPGDAVRLLVVATKRWTSCSSIRPMRPHP